MLTQQPLSQISNVQFKQLLQDRDIVIKSILQQNSQLKYEVENFIKKDQMTKCIKISQLKKFGVMKKQKSIVHSSQEQLFIVLNVSQCGNQIILDQRAKIVQFSELMNLQEDDCHKDEQKQREQLQRYCSNVMKELQKMRLQLNRQKQIKKLQFNDRQEHVIRGAEKNLTDLTKKINLQEHMPKQTKNQLKHQNNGEVLQKPQDILVLSKVQSHIEDQQQDHQQNEQPTPTTPNLKPTTNPYTPIVQPPSKDLVASSPRPYIWQEQSQQLPKKTIKTPQSSKRKKYKVSYIRP